MGMQPGQLAARQPNRALTQGPSEQHPPCIGFRAWHQRHAESFGEFQRNFLGGGVPPSQSPFLPSPLPLQGGAAHQAPCISSGGGWAMPPPPAPPYWRGRKARQWGVALGGRHTPPKELTPPEMATSMFTRQPVKCPFPGGGGMLWSRRIAVPEIGAARNRPGRAAGPRAKAQAKQCITREAPPTRSKGETAAGA